MIVDVLRLGCGILLALVALYGMVMVVGGFGIIISPGDSRAGAVRRFGTVFTIISLVVMILSLSGAVWLMRGVLAAP
jgi:hypothetical protein